MDDQTLRPAVGGKEIGYLIEFLQDGVYVTVYPNKGSEVLFELSDVRQTLHDNNVNNYDVIELSKIIREAAGQPRRIADGIDEVPEEVEREGTAEVTAETDVEEPVEETVAGIILI